MISSPRARFLLIIIAVLIFALYFWQHLEKPKKIEEGAAQGSPIADVVDGPGQGVAQIGGPFTLTDHKGQTRKDTDFQGKFLLVYFGYTYCPDICPTGLSALTEALEQLGPKARHFQPLFITIDPPRDTPEQLRDFLSAYHPSLIGLTGTPEQIQSVGAAYKVVYAKAMPEETEATYLMDHSSIIYVMDRKGKFVTHFNHETLPDEMARVLRSVLS